MKIHSLVVVIWYYENSGVGFWWREEMTVLWDHCRGNSNTVSVGMCACFSTVEDEILVDPVDAPEVLDDFELGDEETIDIKDREVNKQKLRRRIEQFKVTLLPYLYSFICSCFPLVLCLPCKNINHKGITVHDYSLCTLGLDALFDSSLLPMSLEC